VITDEGGKELYNSINKNNKTLFELNMSMNQLSKTKIAKLVDLVESNYEDYGKAKEAPFSVPDHYHTPYLFPNYITVSKTDYDKEDVYMRKKTQQEEWKTSVLNYLVKEAANDRIAINKIVFHINNFMVMFDEERIATLFNELNMFVTIHPNNTFSYTDILCAVKSKLHVDLLGHFFALEKHVLESVPELKSYAAEISRFIKFCNDFDYEGIVQQIEAKSKEKPTNAEQQKQLALFYYKESKRLKKAQVILQYGVCLSCTNEEIEVTRTKVKQKEAAFFDMGQILSE